MILFEKGATLGGTTAWSVGSISATRKPLQTAAGNVGSPDEHFADREILAGRYTNRDNRVLRRVLVDSVTEMMARPGGLGVVVVGPDPERPLCHSRIHNVMRHDVCDDISSRGGCHHFCGATSFRSALSSIAPANSFFNFAF